VIQTITTKQLAAILGISVQRVNELGRKGKIQREKDGGWNLVKVNAALRQRLDRHQAARSLGQVARSIDVEIQSDSSGDSRLGSFTEAQRRREWLRVQREEMELQKRRGELAEIAEIEQVMGSIVSAVQTRMLILPGKIAPRVAATDNVLECASIIEREIKDALTALTEFRLNA
jgi:hypothetical protein